MLAKHQRVRLQRIKNLIDYFGADPTPIMPLIYFVACCNYGGSVRHMKGLRTIGELIGLSQYEVTAYIRGESHTLTKLGVVHPLLISMRIY